MKPFRIPVVSSLWLRPFVAVLESMGIDSEPLLDEARVPLAARHTAMPIAEQPIWAFVELSARASGNAGFGFRVAEIMGLESVGAFARRLDDCPTLAHLVAEVAAESTISQYRIERIDGKLFFCRRGSRIKRGAWEVEQYVVTLMVQVVRKIAGPTWLPANVLLQRSKTPGLAESRYLQGAKIRRGQSTTAISIPVRLALSERPMLAAPTDPKTQSRHTTEWLDTLVQVLKPHLPDGYPAIELAAEILDTNARTLQRRLQETGTTYSEIVARARQDQAILLLTQQKLRMINISYDLGYRDPGSFSRAFKTWTGISPREYRRRHQST